LHALKPIVEVLFLLRLRHLQNMILWCDVGELGLSRCLMIRLLLLVVRIFPKASGKQIVVPPRLDRPALVKRNSSHITSFTEESDDHWLRSASFTNNFCLDLAHLRGRTDRLLNLSPRMHFFQNFLAPIHTILFWAFVKLCGIQQEQTFLSPYDQFYRRSRRPFPSKCIFQNNFRWIWIVSDCCFFRARKRRSIVLHVWRSLNVFWHRDCIFFKHYTIHILYRVGNAFFYLLHAFRRVEFTH